jgi:hypothetical protein
MEKETQQNLLLKEQIKRLEDEIKFLRELVNKLTDKPENKSKESAWEPNWDEKTWYHIEVKEPDNSKKFEFIDILSDLT